MGGSSHGVLIMCMTALSISLWLDSLDSSCRDSDFSIDKDLRMGFSHHWMEEVVARSFLSVYLGEESCFCVRRIGLSEKCCDGLFVR